MSFRVWRNSGEIPPDEIDPGKDLFALLFLAFFLINTILVLTASMGKNATPVNTAGEGKGIEVKSEFVGRLVVKGDKVLFIQGGKSFLLPDEADRLVREAKFVKLKGKRTLIIANPGRSLDAGTLLRCVSVLNKKGVAVEFREVY